ncbi:shikimate kinase [Candidatus Thiomargarita nelsonii]|uniref:Shikimate kinase n=1 Tax=Candidatus Thiomargarita nelsonii TaxID=1003181 RepID=A0A0A6RYL6_9GAMM|nr:shikimate kinase [Candidatus Thiomargarita nelsonii]
MSRLTNIFLVGPMGVGKTTIAHHLVEILNLTFIDSDHEIEKQTGVTIPWIFEYEGEAGFRKRERAIIAELTAVDNIILSTGGGVVLSATNRELLQSRGYVIYLHASVEHLLERTAHSHHRPLLQTSDRREKLETLFRERHPLYTQVADVTIETGQRNIRQVVKAVLKHLQKKEHEKITS